MSDTATSPTVFPVLNYRDAARALAWLRDAFGFEQIAAVPDENGGIVHAEMHYGAGIIMFGGRPSGNLTEVPADPLCAPCSIYVQVDDVDGHHVRARAAGAEITAEPRSMDYGSREYSARDLEGNHWHFGTYGPRLG